MYPLIRMSKEILKARRMPPLGVWEAHVSQHMCWPWDIDPWMELNNGRTLTLFDLGRVPLAYRTGLIPLIKARRWGMVLAGASVRYRRRVVAMERIEMRSRAVGFDDRFAYMEQSMWKTNGDCANHALLRAAFTSANGIVPPSEVFTALGAQEVPPALPDWIQSWIAADAERPWPPMTEPNAATPQK